MATSKAKKAAPAKKVGRPSKYTEALATAICERIASGESLHRICAGAGMPALRTVLDWLTREKEFPHQYARARELQAETLADQIVSIADGETGDGAADVAAAKLRIDARKWVAAKLLPKKYGDRVTQEHTGPGGGPIQTTQIPSSLGELAAALGQGNATPDS